MGNKKIPKLKSETLYELGTAGKVQQSQIFDLEGEALQIKKGLDALENMQQETYASGKSLISELEGLLGSIENTNRPELLIPAIEEAFSEYEKAASDGTAAARYDIKKTREVITNNRWDDYYKNLMDYADSAGIDRSEDPFLSMLGEKGYKELSESIDGEFAKRTSIKNKTDLKFLAVAIALEVAKGLLYPIVAEKAGYSQSFDPDTRLDHNDKAIKEAEKNAQDKFRDDNVKKKGQGKWIEFVYRKVPYDITAGTGSMEDVNLHGGEHRLYTLGHDPILGWIFGTANILTDVITISPGAVTNALNAENKAAGVFKLASMRSYRVVREPKMKITPERVPMPLMFKESYDVAREDPMNLPAAVFRQGLHLKTDINTKMGLPVPVLEEFAPDFASKLYKDHYDALCFARDVKIIGVSAAVSIIIDTMIGLIHGLYYDPQKDGSRDLYEVRTRKILLIANTIGTSSNLIFTYLSGNVKSLDIGGLLVTLSHLFSDTRFLLNVKKEFVENKLYEKISAEMAELDAIEQELVRYGEGHRGIYS